MNILIISNPKRIDFHGYLFEHFKGHNLSILWHYDYESYDYELRNYVPDNVNILIWKKFRTPSDLIRKLKPDRILFFEIIDFWQIPLIITAHRLRVASFFIEHGVGNSVEVVVNRFREIPPMHIRFKNYFKRLSSGIGRILHNRIFFLSACPYLPGHQLGKYLRLPIYYKRFTPIQALSKLKFRNRTPHYAILFNRNNIPPFLLYNEIEPENIITEGVPFYDKYFVPVLSASNHIFFIEHPYLEEGILGWTPEFHEKLARTLERFAKTHNIPIIIKLHPRSNIDNWLKYKLDKDLIIIKQKEDVLKDMLEASLILGYSSTMMNILIGCKKNVVLLGWHPQPQIFGDDYSRTGLCHVSFDMSELETYYEEWILNNKTGSSVHAFDEFLKEYNFPFDGKATQRTIKTILEKTV